MDGWMDELMDGWVDRRVDGWLDRQMDERVEYGGEERDNGDGDMVMVKKGGMGERYLAVDSKVR